MIETTSDTAVSRIKAMGRGSVFTPKDFLDIATHDNARAILSRLAKKGTIRRLRQGVYEYPAYSNLLKAPASPDPNAIAHAIGRAHGWTLVPSGDTALNLLGLSTQVPARWTYFSDGPSKHHQWAGGTITFKHRTNKETTSLSPRTALFVQALKALGKDHVDPHVLATLRKQATAKDLAVAKREGRYVTSWIYEILKTLLPARAESRA